MKKLNFTSKEINKLKILCFASMLLITSSSIYGQSQIPKKIGKDIEKYMTSAIDHDYFSGSILIAKNGKTIYSNAYEMADREHQVPNKLNTVFLIASITKQFTSMAIMQLVEQGKLNVKDPICKYLTNCPPDWEVITIHNLLTQTSGIMNFSRLADWDEKHSMQPYTEEELINLVIDIPLQFKPGEEFKYSNTNYSLLGLIIEKGSGTPYFDFLDKNIFNPLGMKNTGSINPTQIIPNRASGYYTKLNTFVNAPYENLENGSATGGLQSTLVDLLLWDQALYTTKLVSKKSLDEIFTPFMENYGYGWRIFEFEGINAIGHAGSLNGFSSYLLRLQDEKITVIVLSNSDKASGWYKYNSPRY